MSQWRLHGCAGLSEPSLVAYSVSSKKQVISMTSKCNNHSPQTNPRHCEKLHVLAQFLEFISLQDLFNNNTFKSFTPVLKL